MRKSATKRDNLIQTRDTELREILERFCEATNRDVPATLRAILRLFFREGFEAASRRLNAGLWELPEPGAEKEPPADSPVRGLADRVRARRKASKRKGA